MNADKRLRIVFFIVFIISIGIVIGPPPIPHPVAGSVFSSGTTQAPAGTNVRITDLNNSAIVNVLTWGPIPPLSGAYSANINGVTGDSVVVRAWNATNYGETFTQLLSTTTYANVMMNLSRPSETKVMILYPINNSLFATGAAVNVTVNISVLGSDAAGCNATIDFSQPGIFVYKSGETATVSIGDIARGENWIISWNLSVNKTGTANITVISECQTDGLNFESHNFDTIYNVSNVDLFAPVISIVSPANNSRLTSPVFFFYNVTDESGILNCSLYVNDLWQDTKYNLPKNVTLNFSLDIGTKENTWKIMCTDDSNLLNEAIAGLYNLSINEPPKIIATSVEDPVDLAAADTKEVICNGTITDSDGYPDIYKVNATFFNMGLGMTEQSPDNKSTHYTDSDCALYGGAGNNINFNCTFDLQYYALNGTWACNVTTFDQINATNTSRATAEVNQLIAIEVSPSLLSYGSLGINQESFSDVIANVTNYGNVKLDMELFGYAEVETDNLSMKCTGGNISTGFQRFNLTELMMWDDMSGLGISDVPNTVNDFNLDVGNEEMISYRETYWKLKIPEGVGGTCNGRIVFTALID